MTQNTWDTKDLCGAHVVRENGKRHIGKVWRFVFYPHKAQVAGVLVKRPDILLMFHRKMLFIAWDYLKFQDGHFLISKDSASQSKALLQKKELSQDDLVVWRNLSVLSESGEKIGMISEAFIDIETGAIRQIGVSENATKSALLGKRYVPRESIKRLRGEKAISLGPLLAGDDGWKKSALIVGDEVCDLETQGGLVETGEKMSVEAKEKLKDFHESTRPQREDLGRKAGRALDVGAYETGKLVGKTSQIFADFKREYNKALNEDSEHDQKE
ncbi:MAG: PRC-barrel domain-containing protein [Eggerthellaceae bacterium]